MMWRGKKEAETSAGMQNCVERKMGSGEKEGDVEWDGVENGKG